MVLTKQKRKKKKSKYIVNVARPLLESRKTFPVLLHLICPVSDMQHFLQLRYHIFIQTFCSIPDPLLVLSSVSFLAFLCFNKGKVLIKCANAYPEEHNNTKIVYNKDTLMVIKHIS